MLKLFVFLILIFSSIVGQTLRIEGFVYDAETNEPLVGANIFFSEINRGVSANENGSFKINNLEQRNYQFKVSNVGYENVELNIFLTNDTVLAISLNPTVMLLPETIILESRAKLRETPVAFSDVDSKMIQRRLGSRFLSNSLEGIPDLYISNNGGGFADSRLSIRGFDQTNIAVMINGISINNPENGEVYWSNWADINDAVEYIQVQRGLSATPYSTSSIGGVVNIVGQSGITNSEIINLQTSIGSENSKKYSVLFKTPISSETSLIGMLSRSASDGYADETWSDIFTYYFSLGFVFPQHSLEIKLMGSPQEHGQRMTPQTISTWESKGYKYNPDWGYLNGERLNLRDNTFHKPSLTINHNWVVNENLILSNVLYLSYGKGGGTVPPWTYFDRTENGLIDFDKEWNHNSTNIDSTYSNVLHRSDKALRFTYHVHNWAAFLSSIGYKVNNFKFSLGIDGKYYVAENYSTLGNLLGGNYYIGSGNVNQDPNRLLVEGNKVDYDADSFTRSLGFYTQGEYKNDRFSAYLNFSASLTGYNRIDYFNYLHSDPDRETGWKTFAGYTIKAGINYNYDKNNNIYFNIGNLSKAPLSMNVYNYSNELYSDVKNERVVSLELGYGYKSQQAEIKINAFYTWWKDKAFIFTTPKPSPPYAYFFNIFGAEAIHRGIESEAVIPVFKNVELNGAISFSFNNWLKDINGYGHHEALHEIEIPFTANTKGIYVGNSPMSQITFGINFQDKIGEDITYYLNPNLYFYGRYYSQFNPANRTEDVASVQPWRIPDYNTINFHGGISWDVENKIFDKISFAVNIFNLLDDHNIIDAFDGSNSDRNTSTMWFSAGRRFNLTLSMELF